MDAHSLPRVISQQCGIFAHVDCLGRCECNCHQVCARCLSKCNSTYDATQNIGEPYLVCTDCYVSVTEGHNQSHCEGCGVTTAYRDPAVGDFYLCMNCHMQHAISKASPLAS